MKEIILDIFSQGSEKDNCESDVSVCMHEFRSPALGEPFWRTVAVGTADDAEGWKVINNRLVQSG